MNVLRTENFYDVAPPLPLAAPTGADHFAYLGTSAGVRLARYVGDTWVEDLGTPQLVPDRFTPLVADPSGRLAPGSVVGGERNYVGVTDFVAGASYIHEVEDGWWATPAMAVGGWVFWVERAAQAEMGQPLALRLRRASTNLETVETLASHDQPTETTDQIWLDELLDPLYTPTSAAATVIASREVDTESQVVFGFDGSVSVGKAQPDYTARPGVPLADGGSLFSSNTVFRWSGVAGEPLETWLPESWGFGLARAGTSKDYSTVVVVGRLEGLMDDPLVAAHGGVEPGESSDELYAIEPHPALERVPFVFWPAF